MYVVIWISGDPSLLSKAATEAIREARKNGGISISGITFYELAWLIRNKRISVATSLEAFLATVEAHFIVLLVTSFIARLATEFFAPYPSDPMDRLIGAMALDRGVPLLTRDKAICDSKAVPVIW